LVERVILVMSLFMKLMLYLLLSFIPRDKRLWIFGSWRGQKFADNSKYLFLYILKHVRCVRAIWLTHSRSVVKEVRQVGGEAYLSHSLRGMIFMIRAGCVVTCTGPRDITQHHYLFAGARHIQLWHGSPLKNLEFDSSPLAGRKGLGGRMLFLFRRTAKRFALLISAAPEISRIFRQVFSLRASRIVITGYPRNDVLMGARWLPNEEIRYLNSISKEVSFKHLIVFLPTRREGKRRDVSFLLSNYEFDAAYLDKVLERNNAVLVVKLHASSRVKYPSGRISHRVLLATDADIPDVYLLLRHTDVLITDYSSVYFDYLMLNRPIIFAPFDLKEYSSIRPFYWDYESVTPGPKARNWRELADLIEKVLSQDRWRNERDKVRARFNTFCDAENSRRVFDAIVNTLGL